MMATRKKKGREKIEDQPEENLKKSITMRFFNILDEGDHQLKVWIQKNKKALSTTLTICVISLVGYFAYRNFIFIPTEKKANKAFFFAKEIFKEAESKKDSLLYEEALKGNEKTMGLVKIIENYSRTSVGDLSRYFAGISHLALSQYDETITYLKQIKPTKDPLFNAIISGNIGQAYLEKYEDEKAFNYFMEAGKNTKNDVIAPLYFLKAGKLALSLKKYKEALDLFKNIKVHYPNFMNDKDIDIYIYQAKYAQ